jgi:hypothetical protein
MEGQFVGNGAVERDGDDLLDLELDIVRQKLGPA